MKEYPREYEQISCKGFMEVFRLKVPNGWIVTDHCRNSQSSLFISDPNHEWKLEPKEGDVKDVNEDRPTGY